MTLSTVLLWSLARTVVVATLTVVLSQRVLHSINECRGRSRQLWLAGALVPLLIPELLVGFTYRLASQQLTDSVWSTELLYVGVLLFRSLSVCIFLRLLLPASAVSRESIHAWKLLKRTDTASKRQYRRLLLTGPLRVTATAWCLTALISFQDFETAALIQVERHPVVWTVWLFDAHAGNQLLGQTLQLIVVPICIELLLLSPVLWLIAQHTDQSSAPTNETAKASSTGSWWRLVTLPAAAVIAGWPIVVSLPEMMGGLRVLFADVGGMATQQFTTFGFSVSAALISLGIVVVLRRWNHRLLTFVALLPGLSGSLVLSLLLLRLFQFPGLNLMWDTWLPLLLGQSLLLLPRAWVLLLVLEALTEANKIHSARLLNTGSHEQRKLGSRLLWRLLHLRWLVALALLCQWCTWDVTTASILRPVTVEPVVTRLYQEMHFSRTESLTALAAVTMAVPWVLAGTVLMLRKVYTR